MAVCNGKSHIYNLIPLSQGILNTNPVLISVRGNSVELDVLVVQLCVLSGLGNVSGWKEKGSPFCINIVPS